jgi:hypothetical protein
MSENDKWNERFIGMVIGFVATLPLIWSMGVFKDDPTYWCSDLLDREQSELCLELYYKSQADLEAVYDKYGDPQGDYYPTF